MMAVVAARAVAACCVPVAPPPSTRIRITASSKTFSSALAKDRMIVLARLTYQHDPTLLVLRVRAMPSDFSIDPFPENIDRQYFASWLSGFVDGEGCFTIVGPPARKIGRKFVRKFDSLSFTIKVRDDDIEILKLIQSFLDCGRIFCRPAHKTTNPCASFQVVKRIDLTRKIIPHFEKYPLLAKKRKEFLIWKDAVLLSNSVSSRKRIFHASRWTEEEKHLFLSLMHNLHRQKAYDGQVEENGIA
jgi:hypothetical protein